MTCSINRFNFRGLLISLSLRFYHFPISYEPNFSLFILLFNNLHRIKIIKNHVTIPLTSKHIDFVVNLSAGVTIPTAWNLTSLYGFVPSQLRHFRALALLIACFNDLFLRKLFWTFRSGCNSSYRWALQSDFRLRIQVLLGISEFRNACQNIEVIKGNFILVYSSMDHHSVFS